MIQSKKKWKDEYQQGFNEGFLAGLEMHKEIVRLEKTGIPRCHICKKNMVKVDEYTWKKDCKHDNGLRLVKA